MGLWSILGIDRDAQRPDGRRGRLFDEIRRIAADRPEEEIQWIAGVAGLLGSVADADADTSPEEHERIRQILADRLRLNEDQIALIQDLFENHRLDLFALESHVYARLVNEVADRNEKRELVRVLFSVAAADASINVEEDRTMWMLAEALNLSRREFVAIRAGFSRHRDVLRD